MTIDNPINDRPITIPNKIFNVGKYYGTFSVRQREN